MLDFFHIYFMNVYRYFAFTRISKLIQNRNEPTYLDTFTTSTVIVDVKKAREDPYFSLLDHNKFVGLTLRYYERTTTYNPNTYIGFGSK